jgi:hypothetical protein
MKMRGSWMKVVQYAGVTVFVSSLLLLSVLRNSAGRTQQADGRRFHSTVGETRGLSLAKAEPRWANAYGKLPLSFEENLGQTAQQVRYVSHGNGYELFLTPQEAVLASPAPVSYDFSPLHRFATFRTIREVSRARTMTAVHLRFEGANPATRITGTDQLEKNTSYFVGNDPKKWRTNVPSYRGVKYAGIYPGVDLVFYGNQNRLEYDFVVAPGADPKVIRLSLEGARKMRVSAHGDLLLSVSGGEVVFQKPVVYQVVKGERHELSGTYVMSKGHQLSFSVPTYDRNEPLVLDPVLNYSTYVGGSSGDSGQGIAVDSQGDAFVVGFTTSTDFPGASGSISAANANGAVFVTEIDPTGTKQLYSTYLAGTGTSGDFGLGIALDSSGNIYVTGATFSTDFPTTSANALKPRPNAGAINGTSFITKINPKGVGAAAQLVYSSYLGGTTLTATDFGNSVAADANGNAYVTGFTAASPGSGLANFPVTAANAFQTTLGSSAGNAFLARIDTTKSATASLIYSTYLGGAGANAVSSTLGFGEEGLGVAVDSAGNAYLAGTTTSTDFPTTASGFQTKASPPAAVAKGTVFVSRIDTTKSGTPSLIYSTYLGGDSSDFGIAIALGGPTNGVAYVTGSTHSAAFPTMPAGRYHAGDPTGSAFISLIDTGQTGSNSLKYSTGLGSAGTLGSGIQADAAGNAYVGGGTSASTFPRTPGAFQPAFATGAKGDGFLSKLNPGGNGTADLVYSTFFGGSGSASGIDTINAIAIDASNPANAFVTGQTLSTAATFPVFPPASATTPAFQTALKPPSDAFVAKLTPIPTLVESPAAGSTLDFGTVYIPNTSAPLTVTLTNNTHGAIALTSAVVNGNPAAANTDYQATNSCSGSIPFGSPNTCAVSVTFKPTVVGTETATLQLTDSDSTSPQTFTLKGTGATPDFSLAVAPASQSVTDGSPATYTVTVTPIGPFSSAVALTCAEPSSLTLSMCTLAPTSVTPVGGNPATSTMTVTTTAFMVPPPSTPNPPISVRQIIPLLVALLLLFLLPKAQRLRTRLGMATAMILFFTVAGCSGKPHTNRNTFTLTITGTSTSPALTHSQTVTLTVK